MVQANLCISESSWFSCESILGSNLSIVGTSRYGVYSLAALMEGICSENEACSARYGMFVSTDPEIYGSKAIVPVPTRPG